MKAKNFSSILVAVLIVSAFSGICLASDNPGDVQQMVYLQDGLKTQSWITEAGGEKIAHTQIIDAATGTLIKQVDRKCSYSSGPYYTEQLFPY